MFTPSRTNPDTATPMKVRRRLFYSNKDKKTFAGYFVKPKRKVGRPKKKKRKYNKSNNKKKKKRCAKATAKEEQVKAQIEGEAIKVKRLQQKAKRTNWDVEPNLSYRARLATSWMVQVDKWRPNESFNGFCVRNGIDRMVLKRYIDKIRSAGPNFKSEKHINKRGPKTTLSESAMRHLCEGII